MALIAVLWVVAALSLMVGAMIHVVRSEVRQAGVSQQQLRASAAGDAAIFLLLQRMGSAQEDRPKTAVDVELAFDGYSIPIHVAPINGWIDLNNASVDLLRLMLGAVGLPEGPAQQLAQEVISYRTRADAGGRPWGFSAPEDLLQVPGFDFDLYAKVAPLVSVDTPAGGNGKVNPGAAPASVLAVLAGGRADVANEIVRSRTLNPTQAVDTSGLDPQHTTDFSSAIYSVQATVPVGTGVTARVTRIVAFGSPGPSGIPWQIVRAAQRLELPAIKGSVQLNR